MPLLADRLDLVGILGTVTKSAHTISPGASMAATPTAVIAVSQISSFLFSGW